MNRILSAICSAILFLSMAPLGAQQGQAITQKTQPMHEWHAMGSSPCPWLLPITRPDGDFDVDTTARYLKDAGFKCSVYLIQKAEKKSSYENYQKLLEATKNTDIEMWAVIIPPSEGASSLPYRSDYIRWSEELSRLSLKYKNFRGFNIDDFDVGISHATFTRDYVCKIYQAMKEINPHFLFIPTIYDLDRSVADRLAGCVDGVWLWWQNLETATGLSSFIENTRYAVDGRFPIYGGVYGHSASWHKERDPDPEVFRATLKTACKYADGAVIWQLSIKPGEPLLEETKPFLAGNSSPYAGKCGVAGSTVKH